MTTAIDAYDPGDTLQQQFLSAVRKGESYGANAYSQGVGGFDLSGFTTNALGFPLWSGIGSGKTQSHAAGAYQFQPGTWSDVAGALGLNFQHPEDQDQAAWTLAAQTYLNKTGGSLEAALANHDYGSITDALKGVWPSATGNGAAPGGWAATLGNLAQGAGAVLGTVFPGSQAVAAVGATGVGAMTQGVQAAGNAGVQAGSAIEGFFVRGGLIVLGAIVVIVALWYLLSNATGVPSPSDAAKIAVTAL